MLIALATVLGMIKFLNLPYGGSITLMSMLAATLCGYYCGPAKGVVACMALGLINFICLVAPHIDRRNVRNNHVYLNPGTILAGASLLLLGDLLARTIISPVVLPIGAITSFLGGPLFLYLLFKRGKGAC